MLGAAQDLERVRDVEDVVDGHGRLQLLVADDALGDEAQRHPRVAEMLGDPERYCFCAAAACMRLPAAAEKFP